jgi:uncharacterized membrane protein YkoI
MKQRLTAFLMAALLLTMTGCSAAGAARALDRAEDKIEHKLETAGDKMEDALRRAAAPAATVSEPVTGEKAAQIALDHVGLTENQVKRLRTDYEIDDGVGQYDVSFLAGDWEYEFEIHAETGRILSFDKDHKYD